MRSPRARSRSGVSSASPTTSSSARPTLHIRPASGDCIEQIFENSPDDFYEKSYAGWYCVGCEAFKQDDEIVDGKCVLHPTRTLEWVEEKNWFFRLSTYTDRLKELVSSDDFLQPKSRRNEILSLIESGSGRCLGKPEPVFVGSSLPAQGHWRRRADHLRLVRRAARTISPRLDSRTRSTRRCGPPIFI